VLFAGEGSASDHRALGQPPPNYAVGALRAARFLADKHSGLYDMQDVLGLR